MSAGSLEGEKNTCLSQNMKMCSHLFYFLFTGLYWFNPKIFLLVVARTLEETYFYIIHINIFCYVNSKQRYLPAEIAVSRFNLNRGVTSESVFHAFCKPGMFNT